jgi:hypothetical protein
MRTGLIYKIENKLNGKIYIGQTITSLSERWSGHKCDSKRRNTPLYASMKKHINNIDEIFEISIIEDNIPYEKLDIREVLWIKKFNSLSPNGYNLKDGGQSFITENERSKMSERVKGENNPMYGMYGELNPFYGQTHSEETKKKMSEMAYLRKMSDETRTKIGESTKQRHAEYGHPMEGRHHTDEAKEKISLAQKNKIVSDETKEKMSQNHARKQSVAMLDKKTNKFLFQFDSMKIASDWIKENTDYIKAKSSEISMVCSGKKKSAYGFKWVYLKGVETIL